jgi:hypothetical protein
MVEREDQNRKDFVKKTKKEKSQVKPKLVRPFSIPHLKKIHAWYMEQVSKPSTGKIEKCLENIKNRKTRRAYRLGLMIVAEVLTELNPVRTMDDIATAEIWRIGKRRKDDKNLVPVVLYKSATPVNRAA